MRDYEEDRRKVISLALQAYENMREMGHPDMMVVFMSYLNNSIDGCDDMAAYAQHLIGMFCRMGMAKRDSFNDFKKIASAIVKVSLKVRQADLKLVTNEERS